MRVIWEEPRERTQDTWVERLEPLKARPGDWARVRDAESIQVAKGYAWQLANRPEKYRLPAGRWEFKGGLSEQDEPGVYARYLGEEA